MDRMTGPKKHDFRQNLRENMAAVNVSCKPAIRHFRNEKETGPSKDFWERYRGLTRWSAIGHFFLYPY